MGANALNLSYPVSIQKGGTGQGASTKIRAYNNSVGQNITALTWTKLYLPNDNIDTLGEFNNSTYRFTVTQAGYYQINGSCVLNVSGSNRTQYISIYINGASSSVAVQMIPTGVLESTSISDIFYLNVGDYVEFYVYSTLDVAVYTVYSLLYLSISRLI